MKVETQARDSAAALLTEKFRNFLKQIFDVVEQNARNHRVIDVVHQAV
jgi:hypothetical protein